VSHLVQIGQTVLSFLLVLGILVFVHEFGHFIVAKAFKIAVPIFSLGFGPRLAGFRRRETE
jgi:regulator of sigma E protease